jgi:hypothetical protein
VGSRMSAFVEIVLSECAEWGAMNEVNVKQVSGRKMATAERLWWQYVHTPRRAGLIGKISVPLSTLSVILRHH